VEATAALKCAIYLDPEFALAHFSLGNIARQQLRVEEAERHYANALKLLAAFQPEDILPDSEGMTVGRLSQIIQSTTDGQMVN
jgi:chemotaxis protein methyltransferase CheR